MRNKPVLVIIIPPVDLTRDSYSGWGDVPRIKRLSFTRSVSVNDCIVEDLPDNTVVASPDDDK